ncbi:MAG: serine/threonine protein kinase [Betaproteobacteria bacterium]|nr:serine/threonine protein kinase [Betaproteobacteria bacterium]
MANNNLKPYEGLTPDAVLDALESVGLRGDGRMLALNSYENRVYQVSLEDDSYVVAKFYRPNRWSDAQILEDHAFSLELFEREIPVVAPLVIKGASLHRFADSRFAVFPRRGGRAPELEDEKVLEWIGRFLGRIHAVGATRPFKLRPALNIETFGTEPRDWLLASGMIPEDLRNTWVTTADLALQGVRNRFELAQSKSIRLHGDCHAGNILWTHEGPHFVDLDDARSGPTVQDLWMLLAGDRETASRQLRALLEGYEQFHAFNREELGLIEPLRTLRLIHYSAWLARRWEDPAFPAAFPWFGTQRYWQDRILELREQTSDMDEVPLDV